MSTVVQGNVSNFYFQLNHYLKLLSPFIAIVFVWPSNQTRNATKLLSTSLSTTIIWPPGVCQNENTSQKSLNEKQ